MIGEVVCHGCDNTYDSGVLDEGALCSECEDAEAAPLVLAASFPARPLPPTELPAAESTAPEASTERESAATQLLRLAAERYELGRTTTGKVYAYPKNGGPALVFRGTSGSGGSLRAQLAREFFKRHGRTASNNALSEALSTLEGFALEAAPADLALRVARSRDGVAVDLADESGACVVVSPRGWEVVERAPVLFRRTGITAPLPAPERGGALEELRELLNVTDASWPLLVGWLVAAFIPDIPHPLLALSGTQGTGKSTAARLMIGLVDPSGADLTSMPANPHDWSVSADTRHAIALDNISNLPQWFSDALCKAATGDGMVTRSLYTDEDVSARSFQKVVILTSIDFAAGRGDLAERLVSVELQAIDPSGRRTDKELRRRYEDARPRVLGALFDLLARVLEELPKVELTELPRMADFGQVLAAVDKVRGTDSVSAYTQMCKDIARQVAEGDPVAVAIAEVVAATREGRWSATSSEILERLALVRSGSAVPLRWLPSTPRAMSNAVARIAPALAAVGVKTGKGRRGPNKDRIWIFEATGGAA